MALDTLKCNHLTPLGLKGLSISLSSGSLVPGAYNATGPARHYKVQDKSRKHSVDVQHNFFGH